MIRGEIWTVSGGADYAGKPRPVVILQSNSFEGLGSVTVCPFTTDPTEAPLLRLVITPADANGLREVSRVMIDKITTVPKSKLGAQVGRMADEDMLRLNRGVVVFLGLAD
ncbi:MAG: putative endoribonuclease MazF [Nitrospira sp.]|nr:putative endoribonuclease MazF [Nitrospira sp.]